MFNYAKVNLGSVFYQPVILTLMSISYQSFCIYIYIYIYIYMQCELK